MDATLFYDLLTAAMALPPAERHPQLARLHDGALQAYQTLLGRLTAEDVERPLPDQADPRTIAQVIAHIAAWDRFAVLAAGDILAGIRRPRMVTDLSGYRETDGTSPAFDRIDDFNAYHAHKVQSWSWDLLRSFAADAASTLYVLFTHPQLLSAARLEQTAPYWKRLQNGTRIADIPMGWNLWLTMLEHLAVEHADLYD